MVPVLWQVWVACCCQFGLDYIDIMFLIADSVSSVFLLECSLLFLQLYRSSPPAAMHGLCWLYPAPRVLLKGIELWQTSRVSSSSCVQTSRVSSSLCVHSDSHWGTVWASLPWEVLSDMLPEFSPTECLSSILWNPVALFTATVMYPCNHSGNFI